MKPIINPWIFYLINVLGNLSIVFFCGAAIGGFLLVLLIIFYFEEEKSAGMIKFQKLLGAIFVISLIFMVLMPSNETMYTMLASNYVTTDNLDKAKEVIKDSVDYILDKTGENDDEH